MKLAIALIGLSYTEVNQQVRDWTQTKDNIKSNLIDAFDSDVYVTTYNQPQLNELLEFYQPKKLLIVLYEGSHQRTTYIQGLKLLLDEDVDFIISTRFDIHFNELVSSYNFDFNKINFIFKDVEPGWTNQGHVGDCLHGIPKRYLNTFIDVVQDVHNHNGNFMHSIYRPIVGAIGVENTNFLIEGNHLSHENSVYKLFREWKR